MTLACLNVRCRFVMGSMHTGLEDKAVDYVKLASFFAERARGGVGLIVTGGIAPNNSGRVAPFAGKLNTSGEVERHTLVTQAVHKENGKILMQILHAGRYGYHPFAVAPSAGKSPIAVWFSYSRALSAAGVERQIDAFVNCAVLAQQAGYDGVEIMGSEGYLINEFLAARTNKRTDHWGGSASNRMRFPETIVKRVREAVGKDFLLMYRISLLDLVQDGQSFDEITELARRVEAAGASILNTGVGWHEARIPTIATMVPHGAFAFATKRLKSITSLPVVASNRINTPDRAEQVLESSGCDLVSMARPFLADPEFVKKAISGRSDEINVCIAYVTRRVLRCAPTPCRLRCNQSCLDHVFVKKRASCLVNPRACYEVERPLIRTTSPKRVLVVGAGPAGLAAANALAQVCGVCE
jgi:2,4-dienoyl-CoA reductase (NADPH2)